MSIYDPFYHRMPDGTIKQINPFNGTEVWCVEERYRGPAISKPPESPASIQIKRPEGYCHFCESEYQFCTPEKARVAKNSDGEWIKEYYLSSDDVAKRPPADFRRVGNLFEIVTYNYWARNYHFQMNSQVKEWREKYLASKSGYDHIMNVLRLKVERIGLNFDRLSEEEKLERAKSFFSGSHELIIGKRHYIDSAQYAHQLCSSGELDAEEHFQYMKFTVDTIIDIYRQNPFVRYVSVFQNWLRPAGASFDHLHRQLVGLDEWGVHMEREVAELRKNPNLYNDFAINFAIYYSLVIAENDHAIAIVEIGHRFPTIVIYSKSQESRPFEHSGEEIRGMSDLVFAVHKVITSQTTCNEEWYYSPFDSIYSSPWHIAIKLRVHTPAGFEGNTKIYINPVSPHVLAAQLITYFQVARTNGALPVGIRIGEEVHKNPNVLNYYKNNLKRFCE